MKTFIERHRLLNHPFAELVAWFLVGNISIFFGFAVFAEIVKYVMSAKCNIGMESAEASIIENLIIILGTVSLLYIFKKHYSPCFKGFGCLENCRQQDIILYVAIFIGVDFVLWIIDVIRLGGIVPPSFATLVGALQPGITEEITDRMLPLAAAMYVFRKRKTVGPLLLFTSALFGLTHLVNLIAGADLGPTIVQIFSAGAAGVFMAAVYLRTGSFLPGMLVHFLHDYISYLAYGMGVATGTVETWDVVEVLIFATVQLVLTYFLLKDRNESIQAVWSRIWVNEDSSIILQP